MAWLARADYPANANSLPSGDGRLRNAETEKRD
jgi:hypothetical protein